MKRISFMFVTLLCMAFGMQAQTTVTDLSNLSNDKVYTVRSARAFLLYSDKVPGKICSSNGNSVGSVTYSLEDTNLQFRIEKNGENYYLYSEGAGMYVGADGSYEAKATTPPENREGGWRLPLETSARQSGYELAREGTDR